MKLSRFPARIFISYFECNFIRTNAILTKRNNEKISFILNIVGKRFGPKSTI